MEEELDYSDILIFPQEIKFIRFEGKIIVIGVDTANWILLTDERQLNIFNRLKNGASIGELIESIDQDPISGNDFFHFQFVLKSILARKFAGINQNPRIELLEGYRMLNIYLTNACNLKCTHCFMKAGVRSKNELSGDEWIKVLNEFHANQGETVTFSGGEPLLHPDFEKVVTHAHKLGLKTTILSNGLLWNDSMINRMAPLISEIQFSIDGVDESTNSKIRGDGFFDTVIKTVLKFSQLGVRVSISTTFTKDNLEEDTPKKYAEFRKAIQEATSHKVFFKLSKKLLNGRDESLANADNEEYMYLMKSIERECDPNADSENFMMGHTPNLVARNCGFGGISISSDGEVYFCNRILEVDSYGNIRHQELKHFMALGHDLHIKTSVDNVEPCKQCELRYICDGGCRIDDFNFSGRIVLGEKLIQTKCTTESKQKLLRRMVDSYLYLYDFDA